MNSRILTDEILDHLEPDDPRAIRSRWDIRRLNILLGNFRWLRRALRKSEGHLKGGTRIVELGAGCGAFGIGLHRQFPDLDYAAIDLVPRPPGWPDTFTWHQGDIAQMLPELKGDILIANLFVHHLSADQLRWLGGELQRFRTVIFAEPARARRHHTLALILYTLGLNHVTRHDMHASIDSGFRGRELPASLGLESPRWNISIEETLTGMYRMIARKS